MNTLAVWVPSCPSHVHYGSRGEPLRVCALVSLLYSQESHLSLSLQLTARTAPPVLQSTVLCRSTNAKPLLQLPVAASTGSLTGEAAGEGQLVLRYTSGCHDIRAEVPHQLLWPGTDWQQQNSPLPQSTHGRFIRQGRCCLTSARQVTIPTEHHSPLCPATATPRGKARYLNLFCFSFLSYIFPTDHCQPLLPAFHSKQPPPALCSHKASHSSVSTQP